MKKVEKKPPKSTKERKGKPRLSRSRRAQGRNVICKKARSPRGERVDRRGGRELIPGVSEPEKSKMTNHEIPPTVRKGSQVTVLNVTVGNQMARTFPHETRRGISKESVVIFRKRTLRRNTTLKELTGGDTFVWRGAPEGRQTSRQKFTRGERERGASTQDLFSV